MPPIELPTSAAFSIPSSSISSTTAAGWSYSSDVAESDLPHPGTSTAITRNDSASGPMLGRKLLQPVAPAPLPCSRITGWPSPASL